MPAESYIVAGSSLEQLRARVEERTGAFANARAVQAASDVEGCYLGEHAGASYLYAGELALLAMASPDFVVNLSRELGSTVVGFHFETVSDTYHFVAAREGQLLRFYVAGSDLREPLSMGEALPSERHAPLASREGLYAALRALGLGLPEDWFDHAPKLQVDYPANEEALEHESSPLGLKQREDEHRARHGMSMEEWHARMKPMFVPMPPHDSSHDTTQSFDAIPRIEPVIKPSPKRPPRSALRRWALPCIAVAVAVGRYVLSSRSGEPAGVATAQQGLSSSDMLQIAGVLSVSALIVFLVRRHARRADHQPSDR